MRSTTSCSSPAVNNPSGIAVLPERQLNPLLRRMDWSVLLPGRAPRRSACAADGVLAHGLGLISREVVPLSSSSLAHCCDLAVVQDPDAATLRAAFAALRPGG